MEVGQEYVTEQARSPHPSGPTSSRLSSEAIAARGHQASAQRGNRGRGQVPQCPSRHLIDLVGEKDPQHRATTRSRARAGAHHARSANRPRWIQKNHTNP
jgi:hypothetical protein